VKSSYDANVITLSLIQEINMKMKYRQRNSRQWSILTVGFILTMALVSTPRLS
jgi:hypothetical protein